MRYLCVSVYQVQQNSSSTFVPRTLWWSGGAVLVFTSKKYRLRAA